MWLCLILRASLALINHFQPINSLGHTCQYQMDADLTNCSVLIRASLSQPVWEEWEIHWCSAAPSLPASLPGSPSDLGFPISLAIALTTDSRLSHSDSCTWSSLCCYLGPMDHYFCVMVHVPKINVLKLAGSVTGSSLAVAAESLI